MADMILQYFQSLDIGSVLFEIAQCLLFIIFMQRKKRKDNAQNASDSVSAEQDLVALAEYHENCACRIRQEINKNKE